jgi:tetratricopeptide (TPR) repeat protein
MAPEQAAGKVRSVGPGADVYALGAILYELLTGRPPFRGETPLDTLQQVQSAEPVPPRALQPKVPADLATVCLKCLQKDPGRRYESAGELADDLRRFLDGRPIKARPVGRAARLWRWCRREPALAGVTAALVLVVAGALAGLTALWLRAEHHRRVAEARREEAAADLRLAREAVDNYATRVGESLRLRQEDLRPLRKELLETVVPLYEKLIARHGDRPEIQAESGEAYVRLALITRDIEDPARAARLLEQAAAVFAALAAGDPDVPEYRQRLADVRLDLGETYHLLDRGAEAEAALRESLAGWGLLAAGRPGEPKYELGEAHARVALARLLTRTGRLGEARTAYEQALGVAGRLGNGRAPVPPRFRRAFAVAHHDLGQVYSQGGDLRGAEEELRRAVAGQEELLRAQPHAADYTQDLAASFLALGDVLWKAGRVGPAEEEFKKSIRLSEELVRDNSSGLAFPVTLAASRRAFARFYAATKQPSKAVGELEEALATLRGLRPAYRDLTSTQERLADTHRDRASALYDLGRYEEAIADSLQAQKITAGLLERHTDQDAYRDQAVSDHRSLANNYRGLRNLPEAEAESNKAVDLAAQLAGRHPGETRYQINLSMAYTARGACYYAQGRKQKCEEAFRKAVEVADKLDSDDRAALVTRAKSHNNLAVLYVDTKRLDAAAEEYAQAVGAARRLVVADPHTTQYRFMLGTYSSNLGIQQRRAGRLEASLDSFAAAIEALGEVLLREVQHAQARTNLASAHWERALALNKLGRAADALPDWEKALALDGGERRPSILANRAESLARAGDHARAMTEAEALVAAKDARPAVVYWMAWVCAYAKTAAEKDGRLPPDERARLAGRYAARGVELLRRAHAAGHFKDPAVLRELRTAADLDALRQRPDFRTLLAEVEKPAGAR